MKIENLKTASLIPYARNSRTHSAAQIRQIAASISEFGFTNPVLIDADNGIIAGHGRVMAAGQLNLKTVPCIRLGQLTEAQKRAYIIADNKLALNAGWDEEMLRLEMMDLQGMEFNLDLLGFDTKELDNLLHDFDQPGDDEDEELPPPPSDPVSKAGDIWLLGGHRLMCGDSTNAADVQKLLNGFKPHLMVTDPPYGVEYDANWRNKAARKSSGMGNRRIGAGAVGKVLNDDKADWREAWALFAGDVAYIWHASKKTKEVINSIEAAGFEMRAHIFWNKNHFPIGSGDYHQKHEPCIYAVKKGKTGHFNGDRTQTTVWDIAKNVKSETGHSTQKPIECMRRPIINNSKLGDFIYEPFSGSGTTLVACEQTDRKCLAMELNPAYVDMAVQRWETMTGLKAKRESA